VLATDDDVGLLGSDIALIAVQGYGLGVDLDLVGGEAALDEGRDQRLRVAEFGLAFDEMGHGDSPALSDWWLMAIPRGLCLRTPGF
jgi:hypothetical protein